MDIVKAIGHMHGFLVPAVIASFAPAYQEYGSPARIEGVQDPKWFATKLYAKLTHDAVS